MNIKPIKNEQNYQESLSIIESLMDAKPNTPQMDELEILTTLVESYEEQYYKIDAPDPIAAIKFRMEQEGLKQKDLIRDTK
jgi:HTH-type transcriptional regulator/antitoxin HigA